MRPLCPVSLSAFFALIALNACVAGGNAAPLENFDPSQVRMLPDNPYFPLPAAETASLGKR